MKLKQVLFVVVATIGVIQCSFVETLNKCKLDDAECLRILTKTIVTHVAESGIPELNMDPCDPFPLKDMMMTIQNLIEFKIIEGEATGFKDCIVNKFDLDVKKMQVLIDLTTNLDITGQYYFHSSADIIQQILGGPVHGNGTGKIQIKECHLQMRMPVSVTKRGENIILIIDHEKQTHSFEILKKVKMSADKLYIGDKESTQEIVDMLNKNWRLLVSTFGNKFFDITMDLAAGVLHNFFDQVSLEHLILDDLTPYLS